MTLLTLDFAVSAGECKASSRMVKVGGSFPIRGVVALLAVLAKLPAMLVAVTGNTLGAEPKEGSVQVLHADGRLLGGNNMRGVVTLGAILSSMFAFEPPSRFVVIELL